MCISSGLANSQNVEIPTQPQFTPCLTDSQYHTIFKNIEQNRQLLESSGKIMKQAKRTELVTLFSWPLRKANHFHDQDYYVISNYVDHAGPGLILDYQGGTKVI